ncbi:hypothetical protein BH11BAC4_BH11BAC4_05250 [soil metagenome]
MQNLFDASAYNRIAERMNKLSADSKAVWGKMNVAQMLAHCKGPFKVALSEKKMPRMFLGILIGWVIKPKLYNDTPYKEGLPTSPDFIIKDERDFNKEKQGLMELMNAFRKAGPTGITKFAHPMFGKFTPEQWGKSLYKHIDHHLRQFGV